MVYPSSSFKTRIASKVESKWRVGTESMEERAVLSSFGWGGWHVIPQVMSSATPAVSADRKMEPTLLSRRKKEEEIKLSFTLK